MGNAKATKLYRDRQQGREAPLKSCPQCGKQVEQIVITVFVVAAGIKLRKEK